MQVSEMIYPRVAQQETWRVLTNKRIMDGEVSSYPDDEGGRGRGHGGKRGRWIAIAELMRVEKKRSAATEGRRSS